jgi:hypothetical protein
VSVIKSVGRPTSDKLWMKRQSWGIHAERLSKGRRFSAVPVDDAGPHACGKGGAVHRTSARLARPSTELGESAFHEQVRSLQILARCFQIILLPIAIHEVSSYAAKHVHSRQSTLAKDAVKYCGACAGMLNTIEHDYHETPVWIKLAPAYVSTYSLRCPF